MRDKNISIKILLFLVFLTILRTVIPAICFADADNIFKENNKAVVVVVTYDEKGNSISQGSGFIVRADGGVVTNYHVISNAKDIKVKAGNKVLEVEGLIHTDKENDLVILKIKGQNLPTVKLGDIEKASIGEKVYVISSPEGLENTISDGILSGIREIDEKRKILQITAPVSSGSSGGPVFNKNGEVIGIATFLLKEAQNLNFAMPVNLIKEKIESKKVTALKNSEIEDYKKTAEYWVLLGFYLSRYGSHKEAIEAFKEAIRIKPDDARFYFFIGMLYNLLGKTSEAIDTLKQAIKLKPDFADAYNWLGVTYNDLRMYKDAIGAYQQAIKFKPNLAFAHYGLGLAYDNLGIYKEAIEEYKKAITLEPDDAKYYFKLGNIYSKLKVYQEAIELYNRAIRIKPDFTEAYLVLGNAYLQLNMNKETIEVFKQAIKINPDDPRIHSFLGHAYGSLAMYKEAIEAFKQAIKIKPDDVVTHDALGYTYLILNDKGSALEEYKILKTLDPERANKLFDAIYK